MPTYGRGRRFRKLAQHCPGKRQGGLLVSTATVIGITIAIWIAVRESGISNPAAEVVAAWASLVLAPLASALLACLDKRPRVVLAWAAWAWLATVSVLAVYNLVGPSSSLFLVLSGNESAPPADGLDSTIHPQALAVWLVAVVSFVVAYRAGKLRSYGALLLGLLWFPIAVFAASLRLNEHEFDLFPDPVGYASMVTMGCVLLVIMWRVFGPEETTATINRTSLVATTLDCGGPEAESKPVATARESAT